MKIEKSKIVIVLICCFLGVCIISFLIKRDGNLVSKDTQTDNAGKTELQENKTRQKTTTSQNKKDSNKAQKELEYIYDNIDDLEALSGELIEGDIGDVMDKIWSSREITCDFSDRKKLAQEIGQFSIVTEIVLREEQIDQLRNCATEMIFNNGNNDSVNYLNYLRESGEMVSQTAYDLAHKHFIQRGIPEEDIPTDPWELLSGDLKHLEEIDIRSKWKGLVSEGCNIKIFEARTSQLPIGKKLKELRGAIKTYRDMTAPPISLDDMLTKKEKVIMADVMVLIAHDDSTGGVVWPYIIRYWFDSINNSWRVHRAALFKNRHKRHQGYILP